jgi:hypothetical protein
MSRYQLEKVNARFIFLNCKRNKFTINTLFNFFENSNKTESYTCDFNYLLTIYWHVISKLFMCLLYATSDFANDIFDLIRQFKWPVRQKYNAVWPISQHTNEKISKSVFDLSLICLWSDFNLTLICL